MLDTFQEIVIIMLIKFQSEATAPFSMLADDAKPLLRGMGVGENLEGSISGANLREAQAQLESALRKAAQEDQPGAQASDEDDPDEEPPVAVSVRAAPLLDMMRKAQAENTYVMWQPE